MCDVCNNTTEGLIFYTYNPVDRKTYEKTVCRDCLGKLVNNYFNPVKTGSW
jgi:hypothetical protein